MADLHLEGFLPYRLAVTASAVSRRIARMYETRFDLSIPEWRVLAALAEYAPLTANDLTRRTTLDKVQVSRTVARMLKRDLLTRTPDDQDRRRTWLSLSPAGQAMFAEIAPLALACEAELLSGLSAAEQETLYGLLARLADRAEGPCGAGGT